MLKKRHLVLPVAICSFLFIPLLSGFLLDNRVNAAYATAEKVVVWEGNSDNIQLPTSELPAENPDSFQIEFSGGFDNADIYDSEMNVTIKTILEEDNGETTFTDSEWASIKSDISIWIWTESKNITKISYTPKSVSPDHTHSGGTDALSFYNWDGGTDHNSMPSVAGSYCLTSDIELTSAWSVPEGTTNLCLNGHNIIMTAQDQNVISIGWDATLNLYDCGTQYQFFGEDANGLWSLLEQQDIPTDYAINGGCITGVRSEGEKSSGAICCEGNGVFNMYGGNIVGNKSDLGGGVYNTSTFTMYGGNICGNVALTQGGGVYCTTLSATILIGGNITENKAGKGSGLFQKFEECFAVGTPITMADGTRKAIEDLSIGDEVRVFDHDEGTISSAKLFDLWSYPEKHSGVMNLHFTNSIDLTVVYGHSFFEREENKYVSVTRDTVSRYVGHEFYNVDNNRWETLTGYDFVKGEVDTYVITSEYHLNAVANGMLSNEDGFYTILTNIFDYDENLKIDQEKKAQDIQKYGLYPFENFKHMSKDTYDILGGQYLSVAFGKGLVTEEYFKSVEDYYSEVDPDLFCDDTNETNVIGKSIKREKRSLDPVNPPNKGLFVGGSIKILDNDVDNLLQESKGFVNIGSGTVGDGNGVIVPNEDMTIGISLQEGAGRFTTSGVEDYSSNFFSDSEDYAVRFNNNETTDDYSDDYLELAPLLTIRNETPEDDKAKNNGYIEVDEFAVKGDEVSVTVSPNQGYKLASLKYNDGENDHDIEDLSFVMPDGDVSVSAVFETKALQVIKFSDFGKVFDNNPINIVEKNQWTTSNYFERLGDGDVTVEFKEADADDETYTTSAPTAPGNYIVRVSVAESTDYLAGSATKDFTIEHAKIAKVGFGDIAQPVAGEVAQTTVTGIAIGAKYSGTLTWSTAIPADGKYACNTTYTATVALNIVPSAANNYEFADDVVVEKPALSDDGWALSDDSTSTQLILTKTFETTADHSVSKVSGTVTCTTPGYKDAYLCETCGLYYEDEACTTLIGDATAYALWKEGDGKSSVLDHEGSLVEGLDPTYENDGYKMAYKCSVCNEYFEDEDCTKLIGDEAAYNAWKANAGHLDKLAKEEPTKSNTGLIVGATCGGTFSLLLLTYTSCYFFLYRKGKLDARKIRAIYKFLPRGDKNLKE